MNYRSSDTQIIAHTIKLSNGIPASIFFLLLFAAGWYIEDSLSKVEQASVSVRLAPKSAESTEADSSVISLLETEKVKSLSLALYQLIIDGSLLKENYQSSEILEELEALEKDSVIVLALKQLGKQKHYNLAHQYLSVIPVERRLKLGLQFSKAFAEAKLKKAEEAISSYQTLLQYQPNNQAAVINLGYLLLGQNKYQEAEQLFTSSIELVGGKRKSKVLSGLANSLIAQGKYSEAVPHFQKAIEYRPSHALTWRNLAEAAELSFSDHHLIQDSYEKAIALDRNNLELYLSYSHYLIRKLDYNLAINQLKKARKLSRENFNIRYLLAFCYYQVNKPVNANKQLSLANKIVKRSSDQLKIEATQNYLKGEYRLSINLFKGLLKKNRDNAIEYFWVAKNYTQLKKPKNAKVYIDKIAVTSSMYYLAQRLLAENYLSAKSFKESSKIYTDLSLAIDDNPTLHYQASVASEKADDFIQAKKSIEQALKYHSNRKTRLKQADIEWQLGNKQQSIVLLRQLIGSNPNYSSARFYLAKNLQEMGNDKEAITHYENLLGRRDSFSDAQYRLATIYFDESRFQDSISQLNNYLDNRSNSKRARLLLAKSYCELEQVVLCKQELHLILTLDKEYVPAKEYLKTIS